MNRCARVILSIYVLWAALTCPAEDSKEFRAARSVHLGYPAPEGYFFYNEIVVEQSVNGSYFMACGWKSGYFGIQQLGGVNDKVVLFSVWDPSGSDDPNAVRAEDRVEVLYQGQGVRIKRFGGEGTGGQCLCDYNWHVGQTNRFLVGAQPHEQKTAFTAWFFADNAWKKLATFRTRTGGLPLSGYYSFIEDFRRDGQSAHQVRRARFGTGWVQTTQGTWVALVRARFTASNAEWESKNNIDAGIDAGGFFLATGGDTQQSRELRSLIDLPAIAQKPSALLSDFVASALHEAEDHK